jgi:predicted DNA-binding transcriptional regulator AlpA
MDRIISYLICMALFCWSATQGGENVMTTEQQVSQQQVTGGVLPATGYVRLVQIVGNRKKGIMPIIPIGPSSWWAGVKEGKYPASIKLGPRTTVWRVEDIRALLAREA